MAKAKNQIVGEFLRREFPNGVVTAPEVLKKATPKGSEIHDYFEWDDTVAGHEYRLQQARVLIGRVLVKTDSGTVRAYVEPIYLNEEEETPKYVELSRARSNKFLWKQVLDQALSEAKSWRDRYQHLSDLKPIITVMRRVEKKLEKKEK